MGEEVDAVVVGGGPAGSAAAAMLAEHGAATTLISGRNAAARHWTETVSENLASLLPELGLPAAALHSVSGACRWHEAGRSGIHVDRLALDQLLRQAALRAGARLIGSDKAVEVLHTGGRVSGVRTASGRTLRCRVVIDATGVRSQLGRRLARERRDLSPRLVAWRGEARGWPDGMSDNDARFVPCDDGWLFLATWRARTTWTAVRRDLRAPVLPPDIAALPVTLRARAWPATWRIVRPVAGSGWLLAGDAAGRLDPAWGQGLATALSSGIAAGRAASACLANPAHESLCAASYDGWFADRIYGAAGTLRSRYAANRIDLDPGKPVEPIGD